eukprot:6179051-Pleurochrysis_carterae.AAC.2
MCIPIRTPLYRSCSSRCAHARAHASARLHARRAKHRDSECFRRAQPLHAARFDHTALSALAASSCFFTGEQLAGRRFDMVSIALAMYSCWSNGHSPTRLRMQLAWCVLYVSQLNHEISEIRHQGAEEMHRKTRSK